MAAVGTPRPVPVMQNELTFSRKKKSIIKDTNHLTPRSPIKSAPPISRIFRNRKGSTPGAHAVSFRQSQTAGDVSIQSPLYKTLDQLFFDQCFTKLAKLGTGSFGEVWKVQSKEDGKLYAVKKSRDRFRGDFDRKQRLEEVNKSEHIPGHPNCVHFYKAWEEQDHLYIQTELCEMSLKDYSESVSSIEEKEIWNMIVDLCHGLKNLHDAGFAHMDIKPANLFLGRDGQYKIGDFGLVVELTRDLGDAMDGDSKYLAPEIMEGCFSKAADIFSLGITILELACSLELPKCGSLWQELRNKKLPFEFTEGLSDDLILLITNMMDPDPNNRPTVDGILSMSSVKRAESKRLNVSTYHKVKSWVVFIISYFITFFVHVKSYFSPKKRIIIPPKRALTPPPISESIVLKNNEQQTNSSYESVVNSSVTHETPTNGSPHISPLLLKKSPLFQPLSEKKEASYWKNSSPDISGTPKHFCESPSWSLSSSILSERIVRSRLFTCSNEDEDVFDQDVSKNLISTFNDSIA